MNKIFPDFNIRNLRVYYLFSIFTNTWFVMGNWFFYWRKFLTAGEIGLFDAIAFGISIVMEIPSGAFADMFGKRGSLIIAGFLKILGIGMMAFGMDKYILFFGNIIFFTGVAFASGANEALLYDSMLENKQEDKFDLVISKVQFIEIALTVICSAIGGLLYIIDDQLPWIFWFACIIISQIIAIQFTEPVVDSIKFSFKNYLKQNIIGFKELFSKELIRYAPAFLILFGIFVTYEDGLLRLAIGEFLGFDGSSLGFIASFVTLVSGVGVLLMPKLRRLLGDFNGLALLLFSMALGFGFIGFEPNPILSIILMTIIALMGNLSVPWISVIINSKLQSKYRATTLSTLALISKLPYVLVAIFLGVIIENNYLGLLALAIGIILIFGSVITQLLSFFRGIPKTSIQPST